jgi:hypothetical protein
MVIPGYDFAAGMLLSPIDYFLRYARSCSK